MSFGKISMRLGWGFDELVIREAVFTSFIPYTRLELL